MLGVKRLAVPPLPENVVKLVSLCPDENGTAASSSTASDTSLFHAFPLHREGRMFSLTRFRRAFS